MRIGVHLCGYEFSTTGIAGVHEIENTDRMEGVSLFRQLFEPTPV